MNNNSNHQENLMAFKSWASTKKGRWVIRISVLILITILIVIYSQWQKGSSVSFSMHGSMVSLSVNEDSYSIDLVKTDRIKLLQETPDLGVCLVGNSTGKICRGNWKNELWGTYTLCIDTSIQHIIVLSNLDNVFVLNYESNNTTDLLYDSLSHCWEQKEWENKPST